MQYDDDFDEEELFAGRKAGGEGRYRLQASTPGKKREFDGISEIKAKSGQRGGERPADVDSSEDDLLDEMAKFVEAADGDVVKDRSSLVEDDEKLKRHQERKRREAEEDKKRPANKHRNDKRGRYDADGGAEAAKKALAEKKKQDANERRGEKRMGGRRVEVDESKE